MQTRSAQFLLKHGFLRMFHNLAFTWIGLGPFSWFLDVCEEGPVTDQLVAPIDKNKRNMVTLAVKN